MKKHLNYGETQGRRRTGKWRPHVTARISGVRECSGVSFDNCSEPVPGAYFLFWLGSVCARACVCVCTRMGARDLSLHSPLWYIGHDGAQYILLHIIYSFSSEKKIQNANLLFSLVNVVTIWELLFSVTMNKLFSWEWAGYWRDGGFEKREDVKQNFGIMREQTNSYVPIIFI